MSKSPMEFFSELPDPRVERSREHKLVDIIFITLSAVICGAETWNDIESFGKSRFGWLGKFLELPGGIPTHDTFNRFFSAVDTKKLGECFAKRAEACSQRVGEDIVSIDGKCLKGASDRGSKSFVTMVSAWSKSNGICLGQVKAAEKSNEITAIPELLELLALKGCIVTIDAAGCQAAIAAGIREKEADYVLAVKGNQSLLKESVDDTLDLSEPTDTCEDINCDHGRIEIRKCRVYDDLSHMERVGRWKDLRSLVAVEAQRIEKSTGKSTVETRLYITSPAPDAKKISKAVRGHWAVENSLHWSLDVTFNEDGDRKRAGNAAANFSIVNRIALNILKKDGKKRSIAGKRLDAAWNVNYLARLLTN